MFGAALSFIGAAFHEVTLSIDKRFLGNHSITVAEIAAINYLLGASLYLFVAFVRDVPLVLAEASYFIFGLRVLLEVGQTYLLFYALQRAERSVFGMFRTVSIPLLLLVDLALGYMLSPLQSIGMFIVTVAFIVFVEDRRSSKDGWVLVLASAVLSVCTIAMYKYNITNFNTVEAENFYFFGILGSLFLLYVSFIKQKNIFRLLQRPAIVAQAMCSETGTMFSSFAYMFAPASVILAIARSSGVFWSLVSGSLYFHEQHVGRRALFAFVLISGISLMALG